MIVEVEWRGKGVDRLIGSSFWDAGIGSDVGYKILPSLVQSSRQSPEMGTV
jgi:hypothetical protein